mgnify:CR=1 FL=1|jgi:uncharacterized alkaline shock family protein YloU
MLRNILGLILLVNAGWIMLLATGWELPYEYSIKLAQWLRLNPLQSLTYSLVTLLVAAFLLHNNKTKEKKSFITNTDAGELRITHEAIEDIIQRSTTGIQGLRKLNSKVHQVVEGLEIFVFCRLAEGYNIIQVSVKIQEIVRHDVEQYSGIKVKEVKVLVRPQSFLWRLVSKE